MKTIQKICVFCGASKGLNSIYAEAARQLANCILARNMTLVYGGARVGLMGELAEIVIKGGGNAIGVIPNFLMGKEIANTQLTKLHIVETLNERKDLLSAISDAFILLPGGIGSLDEFFEMITQAQLGIHNKPSGILNINGYYDNLLKFLDYSVAEGFWTEKNRNRLIIENNPETLLSMIQNYNVPISSRWEEEKI